jgi:DNA-binding HxlR family transcriptional regulator
MATNRRRFVFDPATHDDEVSDVIELNSRKWTRTIVERLLVNGSLRYSELSAEIDGISDKVLSESLDDLEEFGLVERNVIDDRPVRVEYSLTEAGEAMEQVIDAVAEWIDVYRAETGRGMQPAEARRHRRRQD